MRSDGTTSGEALEYTAIERGVHRVKVNLDAEGWDTTLGNRYDLYSSVFRPEVELDVTEIVPGQQVQFFITNAPPGSRVTLIRSPGEPAPGPCHPGLGICLDIPTASVLANLQTNGAGARTWTVTAPGVLPPGPQSFQAVLTSGDPPTKSDAVTRWVAGALVTIGDATVVEGVTAELAVQLSEPVAQPVSVQIQTMDGSASAPSDYVAQLTTVVFDPGETFHYVPVDTVADGNHETRRAVQRRVVEPDGAGYRQPIGGNRYRVGQRSVGDAHG